MVYITVEYFTGFRGTSFMLAIEHVAVLQLYTSGESSTCKIELPQHIEFETNRAALQINDPVYGKKPSMQYEADILIYILKLCKTRPEAETMFYKD